MSSSKVGGSLKYGRGSRKSMTSSTRSSSRKRTPAWRIFEREIAEILGGRVVRVYRAGSYADIRTPRLLIEAKWSEKRIRISAPAILKVRELAFRHGLYPVLVAGMGRIRVAVLLGDDMVDGVDMDVRRLLDSWHGMGYDVWVATLSGQYPGVPGIIPTTSLRGFRYSPDSAAGVWEGK